MTHDSACDCIRCKSAADVRIGRHRTFMLSEGDWKMLMDSSVRARNTPVILVAGRDASADAHKVVMALWDRLGAKYGFVPSTVEPGNETDRTIMAEPVPDRLPQAVLNQAIEDHDRGVS